RGLLTAAHDSVGGVAGRNATNEQNPSEAAMSEGASPQWIRGTTSRQAHADLPPGTVEEEHGREGFSGRASHLYRLHAPTGWQSLSGLLRPHALDTGVVTPAADELAVTLLDNADVRIAVWKPPVAGEWFL